MCIGEHHSNRGVNEAKEIEVMIMEVERLERVNDALQEYEKLM